MLIVVRQEMREFIVSLMIKTIKLDLNMIMSSGFVRNRPKT